MHAALDDDLGIDLGRLARELERVPDEIGDAIVDFRRLVVVRQDDRVALSLERVDRFDVGRKERPFDRGDDGPHPVVEMSGLALDLGIPFQCGHRQHAAAAGRVSDARNGRSYRRTPGGRTEGLQERHGNLRGEQLCSH